MTTKYNKLRHLQFSCLTVIACLGCTGGNDSSLAPATGVVLLDGKPLSKGTVITTVEKGRGARGSIGPNGEFELKTPTLGDGAEPGTHYVAVIANEMQNPESTESEARSLVPLRYSSARNSGLVIEVKADGENRAELKLTSKQR